MERKREVGAESKYTAWGSDQGEPADPKFSRPSHYMLNQQ